MHGVHRQGPDRMGRDGRRALAESGCKALTVTLLELPWNKQCYDAYRSMIGRVKKADGSWTFDYRLFDEYAAFGRKCGLGPDIACYTMCPWGYMVSWKEESGIRGQESGVEKKIRDIAAPYGYKAAVRGEIDFAAFRRDVESLVNAVR